MRPLALLTAAAGLVALAACEPVVDCTDLAALSVSVLVEDIDGQPVDGVTMTYTPDGEQPVDCEPLLLDGKTWGCGHEVEGLVEIRVSAPGYVDVTETVDVPADECHVIQQDLSVTLQPLDCTDELEPSVWLTLVDAGGGDVPDASATWSSDTAGEGICEDVGGDGLVCGFEIPGDLAITATAPGYEDVSTIVTVEADACHVITEDVELILYQAP